MFQELGNLRDLKFHGTVHLLRILIRMSRDRFTYVENHYAANISSLLDPR